MIIYGWNKILRNSIFGKYLYYFYKAFKYFSLCRPHFWNKLCGFAWGLMSCTAGCLNCSIAIDWIEMAKWHCEISHKYIHILRLATGTFGPNYLWKGILLTAFNPCVNPPQELAQNYADTFHLAVWPYRTILLLLNCIHMAYNLFTQQMTQQRFATAFPVGLCCHGHLAFGILIVVVSAEQTYLLVLYCCCQLFWSFEKYKGTSYSSIKLTGSDRESRFNCSIYKPVAHYLL